MNRQYERWPSQYAIAQIQPLVKRVEQLEDQIAALALAVERLDRTKANSRSRRTVTADVQRAFTVD